VRSARNASYKYSLASALSEGARSDAVGRRTEHAGQTTITLTGLHAHFEKARAALMRVSALLQAWVNQAAEQFNPRAVWNLVCEHLKRVLAGIGPPPAHRLLENHASASG
jgi:hypothetical protein